MNDKYLPEAPPAYGFTSAPEAPLDYQPSRYPQQTYPQYGFPQPQTVPQNVYPHQVVPPPSYVPHYGPLPQPHSCAPQYPQPPPPLSTVQVTVRPKGCFNRARINRAQSNVLSAATLIFISGGLNIAWSVGFRKAVYNNLSTHLRVAWFIGAIIGAAISAFVPKEVPRRVITLFCSMLVLIGGIVNVSTHYNVDALTAALYLNGIANGLLLAPSIALAGELSVFYMRGKICASAEQLSYNLGIFLQILIFVTTPNNHAGYNPERIHGILDAVFGFCGMCFATLLFIESPVVLLARGREHDAVESLRRLQRPHLLNNEVYAQLEEHKRYVADNKDLPVEQSFVQATPAFIKLAILRALNALSISSFMFYAIWLCTASSYNYWDTKWTLVWFGASRLLGSFVSSLLIDTLGRKSSILMGLLLCGCLAFATQFYNPVYNAVEFMLYGFQLFAGLAFTCSSAFLAEAFPLTVKQHFISFSFIVELLVFIIMNLCDLSYEFFYAIGGIFTIVFVLAICCLPETKGATLREAQKRFRGCC